MASPSLRGDPSRQGTVGRSRVHGSRARSIVRSGPKTRACADGMGSTRVLIAWFGARRFLVAPEIKEQLK